MVLPPKEFWNIFKATHGAFSTAESIALYNICLQVPEGTYCELGTHKGKSAISALIGLKFGSFDLVDPIFEDKQIRDEVNKTLHKVILMPDFKPPTINFNFIAKYSLDFLKQYEIKFSFCFVDSGAHDDMVMGEVKLLEGRIVPSGIIAFHDYKNQFTAVERAYNYLLGTGKYEEIKIDWQPIFDYVNQNNLEEGNQSWHQYPELPHPPNFIGALRRK